MATIFRKIHLIIGLAASVVLLVVAITGAILALEPLYYPTPKMTHDQQQISVGEFIQTLKGDYSEILDVKLEYNHLPQISFINDHGKAQEAYIIPNTGKIKPIVENNNRLFETSKVIHRSLFLKKKGRWIVGISAVLLLLIILSGTFLWDINRNWKNLLAWQPKKISWPELHRSKSKIFLIPILMIAVTGVGISSYSLNIIPKKNEDSETKLKLSNAFHTLKLEDITTLSFPFSSNTTDYFQIKTKTHRLQIQQYTGEIIKQQTFPYDIGLFHLCFTTHTGVANNLWALILFISALGLNFLIISGVILGIKKISIQKQTSNISIATKDAETLIFVGSQNGNTWLFAKRLLQIFPKNELVTTVALENFAVFPNTKNIILLTSTYGDGAPPTKVIGLQEKIAAVNTTNKIKYSVVGFGDRAYPKYCAFAKKTNSWLADNPSFEETLKLHTVNDQNESEFEAWKTNWYRKNEFKLSNNLNEIKYIANDEAIAKWEVISISPINIDQTFWIQFRALEKETIESGDLIAFTIEGKKRYYSIAVINYDICLSVKIHEKGLCSNWLAQLKPTDIVEGKIISKTDFHLDQSMGSCIMIANGTGIAPLLGMIMNNHTKQHITLLWGGRTNHSFELYEHYIKVAIASNKLQEVELAFSKEYPNCYIQNLLPKYQELLQQTIENEGKIYICGSLKMQKGVENALKQMFVNKNSTNDNYFIDSLKNQGILKSDCY